MPLLQKDGSVTCYLIKHFNEGRWAVSSLDYFVFSDSEAHPQFRPSGECWQLCGHRGAMDSAAGAAALMDLAEKYPSHEFGLFRVEMTQTSTMLLKPERLGRSEPVGQR